MVIVVIIDFGDINTGILFVVIVVIIDCGNTTTGNWLWYVGNDWLFEGTFWLFIAPFQKFNLTQNRNFDVFLIGFPYNINPP